MESKVLTLLLKATLKVIKENDRQGIEPELKELFSFYDAFMNGVAINAELQKLLFDWATVNGYACVKVNSIAKRKHLEAFVKQKLYPGEKQQKLFL